MFAGKIAVGSSVAIYIAQALKLEYAISAGTITLLTLMGTKWDTVKLSIYRLVMFVISSALIAAVLFVHLESIWAAYGIFVFIMVFLCELLGWRATISVNSVIGAHLLTTQDFSYASVQNEFLLVVIGVSIAFLLNLFQNNRGTKRDIIANMRHTEKKLQSIMSGMAEYLLNKEMPESVWNDICILEKELREFIKDAYEYQNNTFPSHPGYYIGYFEMRKGQCHILHSLHYEMNKIRSIPKQAEIIAKYMLYLTQYVIEMNEPSEQMKRLQDLLEDMKKEEMPKSREEFENRALLYHVLMDIEEFLQYKSKFVESLDAEQLKIYWN